MVDEKRNRISRNVTAAAGDEQMKKRELGGDETDI
jgi:hypothetical protein